MEHMEANLESNESVASGDSDKSYFPGAPQIGAAGKNLVGQGAGGTPIGEEHLSPSTLCSENLEGLREKVGTLGLQVT